MCVEVFYLNNKKSIDNDGKFQFYLDIQYEAPYYQGNRDILNHKEKQYGRILLEIDDLVEEIEPFDEDYGGADLKLLEL